MLPIRQDCASGYLTKDEILKFSNSEKLEIEVFRDFGPKLEDIWRAFEDVSECYGYQCFDWMKHWHYSVGYTHRKVDPVVVVVSIRSQTKYIFPMCIRSLFRIRILEWLGGSQTDYHAPLISVDDSLEGVEFENIWSFVLAHIPLFDVIYFQRQPRSIGYQKNPFVEVMPSRLVDVAHYVDLASSWKAYLEERGLKKTIQDSSRLRRNLSKEGNVSFEIAENAESFFRFINAMLRQKSRRLRSTGHAALTSDESVVNFYSQFDKSIGTKGETHCAALLLNDQIIATHWGLVHRDRFYYMMPAFESGKWARFGPGRLLLEELIRWSIDHNLRIFDFTIGNDHYKKKWCNRSMDLYETIHAKTVRGYTFQYGIRILSIIKHRLKDSLFRALAQKMWRSLKSVK